jgi:hypothetical protein
LLPDYKVLMAAWIICRVFTSFLFDDDEGDSAPPPPPPPLLLLLLLLLLFTPGLLRAN